jgi:hypothetical protein
MGAREPAFGQRLGASVTSLLPEILAGAFIAGAGRDSASFS